MNHDNWFQAIWEELRLFEKKILCGIGEHVLEHREKRPPYHIQLIEFGLDHLNPSDITERLQGLKEKTVTMKVDQNQARVPLLTDIRYHDPKKTVTLTFNSLLKEGYLLLGKSKPLKQKSVVYHETNII